MLKTDFKRGILLLRKIAGKYLKKSRVEAMSDKGASGPIQSCHFSLPLYQNFQISLYKVAKVPLCLNARHIHQ